MIAYMKIGVNVINCTQSGKESISGLPSNHSMLGPHKKYFLQMSPR